MSALSDATFDYVVVGGGSGGSVVAGRLIEAGHSVLVLEAGLTDASPFVRFPGAFVRLFGTNRVVNYVTTPQAGAANRPLYVCQANTLGGGSSVNAMVYIRGAPEDFEDWRGLGCSGWGWQDVLPTFKKSEGNEVFSGPEHGVEGPLKVSNAWLGHPTSVAFVKAGQEVGLPYNADFNGARQEGVGFYQSTIDRSRARRASAAECFLRPHRKNPKLKVRLGCRALRLVIQADTVKGVIYRDATGRISTAFAEREVILAAGALATPKILMHSGVGPSDQLQALNIPVVIDAPDVGQNYQNHVEVPLFARLREPISFKGQDTGLNALRHGLQFTAFKSGVLASNICEVGAFVDTAGDGRPDIQLLVIPALFGSPEWPGPDGHGLTICVTLLRPKSRGSVRLASSDPDDPIVLDGGSLDQDEDVHALVRGVAAARADDERSVLHKDLQRGDFRGPRG